MKAVGGWAIAGVVCSALACQSSIASKKAEGTAPTGTGAAAATSIPGGIGGAAIGGGSADVPGIGAVGGVSGQATSANAGTGSVADVKPKIDLVKAAARIGGRYGDRLLIAIEGKATVGTLGAIEVELLDKDGHGLPYFDSNWDGSIDSAVGRVQPLEPPKTQSFNAEAVLEHVPRAATLEKLRVALYDRENRKTDAIAVAVQQQAVVALGGSCDSTLATNRCVESLSCSGTPSSCTAGTAPTIDRAAYQRGTEGPFIRIEGKDPDEDVSSVLVEFYAADDTRISLDLDGDEQPDADHLEIFDGLVNENGAYHVVIESGLGFDKLAPRLGLTMTDSRGAHSATQVVSIAAQPINSAGQTCDPVGFVGCGSKNTCLPSSGSAAAISYCTTYAQAQTNRCAQAPVWDLGKDPQEITGHIAGTGVWESPSGCTASAVVDRSEAVIKLRVPVARPQLILSTAVAETTTDTVLFVLPTCTSDAAKALACNDDDQGFTSRVVLTDVAAGEYFVIVKSGLLGAGNFGISASE